MASGAVAIAKAKKALRLKDEAKWREIYDQAVNAGQIHEADGLEDVVRVSVQDLVNKIIEASKAGQPGDKLGVVIEAKLLDASGTPIRGRQAWRFTSEYLAWRDAVFARDNRTCVECGKKAKQMHAHHIKAASKHPELRLDVDNGITLCAECHCKKHPHLRVIMNIKGRKPNGRTPA